MDKLLSGNVWATITPAIAASGAPVQAAIAYLGRGAKVLLPMPSDSLLAVDASSDAVSAGKTCPYDLIDLHAQGVRIFSAQNLHAKICCLPDVAYIGSANASSNSQNVLIEAVAQVAAKPIVDAARSFVAGLCTKQLTTKDLERLAAIYRAPHVPSSAIARKIRSTLVMELTNEQGAGRETQVQPPLGVWKHYFGVDASYPPFPTFTLINAAVTPEVRVLRPVVQHHHNLTIEISGAAPPRPAILKMIRTNSGGFKYQVFRPIDAEYAHLNWLLENVRNPYHQSGRKWMLI